MILDPIRLPRWDAGSRAEAEEFFAKGLRVEAAVREDEASGEFIRQQFHRFEVVPVAGHEIQPDARPNPSTITASFVFEPPLVLPKA